MLYLLCDEAQYSPILFKATKIKGLISCYEISQYIGQSPNFLANYVRSNSPQQIECEEMKEGFQEQDLSLQRLPTHDFTLELEPSSHLDPKDIDRFVSSFLAHSLPQLTSLSVDCTALRKFCDFPNFLGLGNWIKSHKKVQKVEIINVKVTRSHVRMLKKAIVGSSVRQVELDRCQFESREL